MWVMEVNGNKSSGIMIISSSSSKSKSKNGNNNASLFLPGLEQA